MRLLLKTEQSIHFHDIVCYFSIKNPSVKEMPNLVSQLNIFIDGCGLLRVGSKIPKGKRYCNNYFPILLSKNSNLTKLLVLSAHAKLFHSGVYSVLTELRRNYWIPSCFSVVKRVLKDCVHCRRYNGRAIKLNQSS